MASLSGTAILEFLQEPTLIVDLDSSVRQANRAAKRLLGPDLLHGGLVSYVSSSPDDLHRFLARCSGSTSPLVTALVFRGVDGTDQKVRAYGARLSAGEEQEVQIALRCLPASGDEFSVLARKVRELNSEILVRQRTQARLEESLASNEVLLRELNHRVKNNIQLMVGLFSAAQREAESQDVRRFLGEALSRLVAIGAAQQVIYEAQKTESLPADGFLHALCKSIGTTFGRSMRIEAMASPGHLGSQTAFPLALIVNELLTNALKHAADGANNSVYVSLTSEGGEWVLVVQDNGPGLPSATTERRSSGLGLVKGLARQLGGAVNIENVDGARIAVRFRDGATH